MSYSRLHASPTRSDEQRGGGNSPSPQPAGPGSNTPPRPHDMHSCYHESCRVCYQTVAREGIQTQDRFSIVGPSSASSAALVKYGKATWCMIWRNLVLLTVDVATFISIICSLSASLTSRDNLQAERGKCEMHASARVKGVSHPDARLFSASPCQCDADVRH